MSGGVNCDAARDSVPQRLGVAFGRGIAVVDRVVEIVTSLLLANWAYCLGICLVHFRTKDIVLKLVDPWNPGDRMHVCLIAINLTTMSVPSVTSAMAGYCCPSRRRPRRSASIRCTSGLS